jgi:hypothetical protein
MGLIAPVIMGIALFFWLALMGTIWCWLQTIVCLFQGKFIRATIWFSVGCGMLFWWLGTDVDFDTWLRGSAVIVGLGMIATFLRYLPLPPRKPVSLRRSGYKTAANDNQLVVFSLHAKSES